MKARFGNVMQRGVPASLRHIFWHHHLSHETSSVVGQGSLRLASYNVHKCVGADRHFDPDRIRRVIQEISPDILALQEVDQRYGDKRGLLDLGKLEAETGLVPVEVGGSGKSHGWHGNLILARQANVENVERITLPGLEPRGAILADLNLGPRRTLRIIAAHLGLVRSSRQRQAKVLADYMQTKDARPAILMGDLNEWRIDRGSPLSRFLLDAELWESPPSFPAGMPLLPLDRIIGSLPGSITAVAVHRSPLARVASDHLPVVAAWSPGGMP